VSNKRLAPGPTYKMPSLWRECHANSIPKDAAGSPTYGGQVVTPDSAEKLSLTNLTADKATAPMGRAGKVRNHFPLHVH
jgi:hypothetical protein